MNPLLHGPGEGDKRHACYKCGEELIFDVKIQRLDTCPNCSAYLRCCRNCHWWDKNAHNQCRETKAEFIRDREAANFCSHFKFKALVDESQDEASAAKAKLDALFGGGSEGGASKPAGWDLPSPSGDDVADARAKLDALFKK